MALSKSILKASFKDALLAETPNPTQPQKQSAERIAEKMADAVNKFVRTATVVSSINPSGTITSTLIT
jgi:hypothetical protein